MSVEDANNAFAMVDLKARRKVHGLRVPVPPKTQAGGRALARQ
jgi:hypothetical protein